MGCTLSRMRALLPKLGGKRCIYIYVCVCVCVCVCYINARGRCRISPRVGWPVMDFGVWVSVGLVSQLHCLQMADL